MDFDPIEFIRSGGRAQTTVNVSVIPLRSHQLNGHTYLRAVDVASLLEANKLLPRVAEMLREADR